MSERQVNRQFENPTEAQGPSEEEKKIREQVAREFDGKSPFQILGLDSNTALEDVKKAYRRLALATHPDRNPNNPAAAEKFYRYAQAYDTLNSEEKLETQKKRYTNNDSPSGTNASKEPSGSFWKPNKQEPLDPRHQKVVNDLADSIFNNVLKGNLSDPLGSLRKKPGIMDRLKRKFR